MIIKKKNNEKRICVDNRRLNTQTIKDFYSLPRIDDTLDYLTDMKWFTTLDLKDGYWQITVHDADKYKTGFCITDGTYQFNVMPFGL